MRNRWLVLLAVCLMAAMIDLDMTIVNLAISVIANHFSSDLIELQWIGSIYSLAGLFVLILGGVIADQYLGKKKVYMSAILFFLIGSAFSAFAGSINWMIFGRAIQGVGFGLSIGLGVSILSEVFPKEKHGFILGIYMATMGTAQALGPSIGGFILTYLDWKWIFLINIPLCFFSFVLFFLFFNEQFVKRKNKPFDFVGLSVSLLVIIMFIKSLHEINQENLSLVSLGSWVIGLFITFSIFILIEKKKDNPFIDLKLFSNGTYTRVTIIRIINLYIWGAILFIIPLYFQNILGFSSSKTGVLLVFGTCIFAISSPVIGKLSNRIGYTELTLFSTIITLIALSLLLFSKSIPFFLVLFALSLIGLASGIVAITSVGIVSDSSSKEKAAQSMGLFYTFMLLGFSLGITFSSMILNNTSHHYLMKNVSNLKTVSSEALYTLKRMSNALVPLNEKNALITSSMQTLSLDSFYYGFTYMIFSCTGLAIFALLLALKLIKSSESPKDVIIEINYGNRRK